MSLLVTSSLIDSVEWLENAPNSPCRDDPTMSWKEKAYKDLFNTLSRAPWKEPNADILRGMKFEQTIYDTLEKKSDEQPTFKCSEEFRTFLDACRGGVFQKKIKRIEKIDGREFCLYGKTDVFFVDRILDLKACAAYGGETKYLGKAQHILYAYITEVPIFHYLVAEFGPVPSMKIKRVFDIAWRAEEDAGFEERVISRIRKAVGFIEQDSELWKLYTTTFSRY